MPPVIGAAISAAAVLIAGATPEVAIAMFALSLVGSYLAPKPDIPDYTTEANDRTQLIRSAVAARRLIYGEMVSSGPLVFAASTPTGENKFLHLVIPLAGHECEAIKSVFLSDQEVTESMLDSSGNVIGGRYSGKCRIKKYLGTDSQTADSDLVSEVDAWTTNHRLRGVAYLYVRLEYDRDVFAMGIPNIKAVVRGRKIYDTRDTATRWTRNPALIARDYLLSSDGIGCTSAEVLDSSVTAAANICDEYVAVAGLNDTFTTNTNSVDFTAEFTETYAVDEDGMEVGQPTLTPTGILKLDNTNFVFATGDQVQLTTSGTLPGGLATSTNYFIIYVTSQTFKLATTSGNATSGTAISISSVGAGVQTIQKNTNLALSKATAKKEFALGDRVTLTTTGTLPTGLATSTTYYMVPKSNGADFDLATSLTNAVASTVIALTNSGSGTHTVTKTHQLRYTADGTTKLDQKPIEIMERLLSSFAGNVVYTAGKYSVFAGAATTQSASFDEDVLAGSIKVQPKFSRRELFNEVRGRYTSPFTNYQETDFPRVTNSTYITQDGETIAREIVLPWTTDSTRAQRLAKIEIERARQSIVVDMPCNYSVLNVSVHDVIRITNTRFGWTNKEFRVLQMQFNTQGGCTLTLQEYASTVWDWSLGEETTIDAAPDTSLPNPYFVAAPGGLTVTEELYSTRASAGVKTKAKLSWQTTGGNADVLSYEVRYRRVSVAAYTLAGTMGEGLAEITDLEPGTYFFEVRAVSSLGVRSLFAQVKKDIAGLLAAPSAITDLNVQGLVGSAVLTWTQSVDLDVRQGGKIRFRHSPLTSGATWSTSTEIGFAVAGASTMTTLPLKAGTYLCRPYDSIGVTGATTSVVSDGATILVYTTQGTATEHTGFSGTKTDCRVVSNILELGAEESLDDILDFDAITNFDLAGGVADSGTYIFSNAITLSGVTRVRLLAHVKAVISNVRETIDQRGVVDDWVDVDNSDGGDADCQIFYRQTDDDPAGSPTWSGYKLLQAAEVQARGFQFKAVLTSADDNWNIGVSELSASAQTI